MQVAGIGQREASGSSRLQQAQEQWLLASRRGAAVLADVRPFDSNGAKVQASGRRAAAR